MFAAQTNRVLIVDEEPEFRKTLSRVLGNEGYDIQIAHPDNQAMLAAGEQRPDLVVLEMGRPRSAGLRFLRALRSVPGCSHVPVILLTSQERNADMDEARKLGVRDHLVMTQFSTRSLRSAVRSNLRNKSEPGMN
jgi:DNA-binding response OmpR family regulator